MDPDSELPPALRLRLFAKVNGVCVECGKRIDGSRERWLLKRLGDSSEGDNFAPAHAECPVSVPVSEDKAGSRGKGWSRKRSLPFGRKSGFKRKITGEVVKRN